jgi:hypothetical protein
MDENQIKVINWIRFGMDYNKGIELLVELTQKAMFSDQFTGREKSMAGKLAYEICKAAKLADHITWNDFIRKVKEEKGIEIVGKTEELSNYFPEIKMSEIHYGDENKPKVFDPDSAKTIETTETAETIGTKPLARCQDKTVIEHQRQDAFLVRPDCM